MAGKFAAFAEYSARIRTGADRDGFVYSPEASLFRRSRQVNFFNQLEPRLNKLPGAIAVAITDTLPPGGDPRSRPYVALRNPGGNASDQGMAGLVKWRYVTAGYFRSLGIPITRGRGFSEADRKPGEQPVILSQSLSRRLFGNDEPIGRRLGAKDPIVVVGIAGDVQNAGLASASDPEFYMLRKDTPDIAYSNQRPPDGWRRAIAIVRSTLSERVAAEWLRGAIHEVDPAVPITLETMSSQVEHFFTRPRFQTALLSMFAATGLVLAAIGLYGLISCIVVERTREIGVRMALGATPGNIVRLVVSDGVRSTGLGVIIGTVGSAVLLRLLQGLLYQVKAYDLRVFGFATSALLVVATIAAWFPGRRASRIDPIEALHHD